MIHRADVGGKAMPILLGGGEIAARQAELKLDREQRAQQRGTLLAWCGIDEGLDARFAPRPPSGGESEAGLVEMHVHDGSDCAPTIVTYPGLGTKRLKAGLAYVYLRHG